MCIRDSLGTDDALGGQHLGMRLRAGDILLIEMFVDRQRRAKLLRDLGHARLKTTAPKTVSYTHLDVYKRQAQVLKVFTAFDCMIARLLRKRSGVFWSNALACNKIGFS